MDGKVNKRPITLTTWWHKMIWIKMVSQVIVYIIYIIQVSLSLHVAYLSLDRIAYYCDDRSDVCNLSLLPYFLCPNLYWTDAIAFACASIESDSFCNRKIKYEMLELKTKQWQCFNFFVFFIYSFLCVCVFFFINLL